MPRKKQRFYEKPPNWGILKFAAPFIIFLIILIGGWVGEGAQQFTELARAFLHGHLNFLQPIGGVGYDPIIYHGKIYWGEGLFPALLLMPFVAIFSLFHIYFYQGYIQWLLVLGVFYFVYKLARKLAYSADDSLTLAFGFVLGSVFIGVTIISSSWLYAQVVTTFLLLWSLYEFYGRRRWWLIGLICGMILLTRVTAAPIVIFFILELWQQQKTKNLLQFVWLLLPVVVAGTVLAFYNFLRFGTPLNGGYVYQVLAPESAKSRSLGIFSPVHLPTNLYSLILRAPDPVLRDPASWSLKFPYLKASNYGNSIFINSPYFLWLFGQKWRSFSSQARNLIVAAAISCLMVLCYYGIGAQQFGYRYSLDFLPELFLLFMIVYKTRHKSLSRGMKFLLLSAGLFNFYLLLGYSSVF